MSRTSTNAMRHVNRFVDALVVDGVVIYLFHGIILRHEYSVRNYIRKHLERDWFLAFLRALQERKGVALTMDDVVAHIREGRSFPPRAYAITFDDGFANNVTIAAPVLAELGIPATFYVSTGWVDANAMAWVDRAEYCLERAAPTEVRLPWEARPRRYDTIASRINLLEAMRAELKGRPRYDPETVVAALFEQCGVSPVTTSDDPLDRKMTWGEVQSLASGGRFLVGGHAHMHEILSFLPADALEREVATSMRLLRDRAGVVTHHYSYPVGLPHCFSNAVITTLRQHGIVCCPTAMDGVNTHTTDLFHLKRIPVMWDARTE